VVDRFERPVDDRTVRFAAADDETDSDLFAARVDGERRSGIDAVVVDGPAGVVRFVDSDTGTTWNRSTTVSGGEYVAGDVTLVRANASVSVTVLDDGEARAEVVDAFATGERDGSDDADDDDADDADDDDGDP
jgi:hypothetical protein